MLLNMNIMNTKIKLFGITLLTLAGIFVGTSIVSAQVVTTCASATFNGSVTPNGYPTTVWFEWGTNGSIVSEGSGTKTQTQTFSLNENFSQVVPSLVGGTIYYYRAMAQNSIGTTTGATSSFNTPLCVNTPTVTTNSATSITVSNGTFTNGVQVDSVTEVTHRGDAEQSALGASSFLPTTIFGWIILLLLILTLILLGNYLYGRFSKEKH